MLQPDLPIANARYCARDLHRVTRDVIIDGEDGDATAGIVCFLLELDLRRGAYDKTTARDGVDERCHQPESALRFTIPGRYVGHEGVEDDPDLGSRER